MAFKKLRNLKNKNFKSTDFNNENNNINNNINKENLTTRIKIDLINEENKKNAKSISQEIITLLTVTTKLFTQQLIVTV